MSVIASTPASAQAASSSGNPVCGAHYSAMPPSAGAIMPPSV